VSVSRLIIGAIWIVLGLGVFRWRLRMRATRTARRRRPAAMPTLLFAMGVLLILLGLLWIDLAFN
jgi:uncharacterized membrane protein YphA (DoxX/SURF4 family)